MRTSEVWALVFFKATQELICSEIEEQLLKKDAPNASIKINIILYIIVLNFKKSKRHPQATI